MATDTESQVSLFLPAKIARGGKLRYFVVGGSLGYLHLLLLATLPPVQLRVDISTLGKCPACKAIYEGTVVWTTPRQLGGTMVTT